MNKELPHWLYSIDKQFELQRATVEAPFEELIAACISLIRVNHHLFIIDCESLQREEALSDERNILEEQVKRLQDIYQQAQTDLIALKAEGGGDTRKYQELDIKYKQLKQERIELLRIQGQNTQRLLELNETVKEHNAFRTKLEIQLEEAKLQRELEQRQVEEYQGLLEERNFNIQILQDELQALQLELLHTDEKIKGLQQENEQLVKRWLNKVNEDASLLENELRSSGSNLGEPLKLVQIINLNKALYSTSGELGDDSVFLATETGPLISHRLETSTFLAAHPGGFHPQRGLLSRDRDYVVGWGAREGRETALIWTLASGRITYQLNAGLGKPFVDVACLRISNNVLLTLHEHTSDTGLLRFYDVPREFCLWTETLDGVGKKILTLEGGNLALILMTDGRLQLWDIQKRKLLRKMGRSSTGYSSHSSTSLIDIAIDNGTLVGIVDRSVLILDPHTFKILHTISLPGTPSHVATAHGCFYVAIKERLAVGMVSGSLLGTCKHHEYPIIGITVIDDDLIISSDSHGTVVSWRLAKNEQL